MGGSRSRMCWVLVAFAAVLTVIASASKLHVQDDDDDDDDHKYCTCNEASINRRGFPDGFIFGSGTAAYQIEGAYNEDGKGISMWDHFTHTYPEKIRDHSNGDVAVDSYHLYKEDVKILKNMGMDSYRFSISWTRILPGGSISKGVNEAGIDYYNNLINELLANGIQPWVTILHLDIPQAFQDQYGGFLSSQIVKDFEDFVDLLFSRFGDRVKHWITMNEPWCLSYLGYTLGVFAPARCSAWMNQNCTGGDSAIEPYIVTHNQLLAHAAAVKLYRNKYQQVQKGKIGISVISFWYLPYDGSYESMDARERAFDFMLGCTMEPIVFGRYPKSMRERVGNRLPNFTKEEAEMLKGSIDFLGLNYYSAKYAININQPIPNLSFLTDSGVISSGERDGIPIGEESSQERGYYSYPKGIRGILQYIKLKYNNPVIYITENGLDESRNDSLTLSEALQDYKRKKYLLDHLCCLREAIEEDGANVKGYFAWSLTDNYEWTTGYLVQFGLHYVDFKDKSLTRHPKLSAQWLKSILATTTEQEIPVSDQ